ncbi:DUF4429 domain-containing protein [Actinacidiphila yeochonensis]|uniref:DUF4429 domain-containing protein n=1 Tax=Actinacidiphila yeochonensis TaxID=89050 RepID=UPI00068F8158|nr:DUF4429 domain-containing protein [Actinacidiphila yeochonensis]
MGDVLSGSNAVWEVAPDALVIRYSRGVRGSRLLQTLGERRVPYGALGGVDVFEGRKGTVVLRALPRPGADPLMEVADGQLRESADPYRLVLPEQGRERAEECRGELLGAIAAAGGAEPCRFLVAAPAAPRSFKAYDAKVSFDGRAVTFHWFRTGASTAKWKAGDQTFPVEELSGVRWRSPEQVHGHLRLLPREPAAATGTPPSFPRPAPVAAAGPRPAGREADPAYQDPSAVVFGLGYGPVHESLPFAAAVLAAIRAARARP